MSHIVRILALFLLSLPVFSQTYPFRWQGSYTLNNLDQFNPSAQVPVSFTVQWREENQVITGTYQDSLNGGTAPISGEVTGSGRRMKATLPNSAFGIKSIELFSGSSAASNGQVPLSITAYNEQGSTIAVVNILAAMSSTVSDPYCSVGFGALSGFCGQYSGTTNEVSDPNNLCNLNFGTGIRLEILPSMEVAIYSNQERMVLGSLPLSPLSNSINVASRHCGTFQNTQFDPTHCHTLNISGSFVNQSSDRIFNGTYTVTDAVSGQFCSYSLQLAIKGQ